MSTSVIDFNDEEQSKIAELLKTYFPWLSDPDCEDISGSETIEQVQQLFDNLN